MTLMKVTLVVWAMPRVHRFKCQLPRQIILYAGDIAVLLRITLFVDARAPVVILSTVREVNVYLVPTAPL